MYQTLSPSMILAIKPGKASMFNGFDGAIAKPLNIEAFPGLIAKIMDGESVWYIA